MNISSRAIAWGVFALQAIAATLALPKPIAALEPTRFFCGTIEGSPATIARTPEGEIAIAIWKPTDLNPPATDLQQHCEETSQRFQTYYESGQLNYITTGMMDGELVACVALAENEPCNGMLFVLNGDRNPRGSLQRIFRIRVASAQPISETSARLYINIDKYLNGEYPPLPPRRGRRGDMEPKPLPEMPPQMGGPR
ncbi:COP23 domain-containing protein [Phormidium sp. CCY1219]|uniref:COP23 domain-containing protein n=1 Tax=Phormidium sp. CCY1219 TaxID=2886104 RepID=UPI002D1E9ADB|nr:COP23 domain-containing protein [Phormidium sp. CCY1219]MEB3831628.1 COP23 domain-containing protein [Phormidium sp. CCY1219]